MTDLGWATRPRVASCHATLSFDDAIALIDNVAAPLGREHVAIADAAGRVLAAPVHAAIDSPRCDVAAMDGYAVAEADLAALPARLHVVGAAMPGRRCRTVLGVGEAVSVLTGAPLPQGADRVIEQERVDRQGDVIDVLSLAKGRHVRKRGVDFPSGRQMLPAGRVIDARALLTVAAADVGHLTLWRKPRIALIATGDEIVAPGEAGQSDIAIPDSLSLSILAIARTWGAELVASTMIPDDPAQVARATHSAIASAGADIVVVIGGSSVGARDFSRSGLQPLGLRPIFAGVAIKPGKPVWLGKIADNLVLGLPGNPTAAMVTARLFLAPLLCRLTGRPTSAALGWRPAASETALAGDVARETFLCAAACATTVRALDSQMASSQHVWAEANALIRRIPGTAASEAGAAVDILDF